MIRGVEIELGGAIRIVPPLSFGDMQRLMPKIRLLSGDLEMNEETINSVSEIITSALRRNYPDLDAEEVKDWLDMGNFQMVLGAIMGVSGLKRVKPGEAEAVAEAS